MATSASLLGLLNTNASIAEATQQLQFWSARFTANEAKLAEQVRLEEKWNNEYDKAQDETRSTDLKFGNGKILEAGKAATDADAEEWADYKVDEYDEELSLELADLDIEYDTMKNMYETLLETLRAQADGQEGLVSENAQDTHLLNAG